MEFDSSAWALLRWRTPARYSAVALLLPACVVHVAAVRRGRERAGRVFVRVAATVVLLVHGSGVLSLGADVGVDAACRAGLGVFWPGVRVFLVGDLAFALAAVCALLAVRVSGHRMRRFVRRPEFRRTVLSLGVGALLCFLPVTDVTTGQVTGGDGCRPGPGRGERVFLCDARTVFPTMPDHLLLAYGRRQCAAYPDNTVGVSLIVAICPAAARQWERELAAEQAEIERREAASQAACDRSRHRPLLKPLGVAHDRVWSETGLQAFEDHAFTSDEAPALHHDLVGSTPGNLVIAAGGEADICVTAETYRRRPPVEVAGWDKVVEIGYESPTGRAELETSGSVVPLNLVPRGRGRYRVRVHYREPVWAESLPQHVLVMVFPGRGDQVVAHKR
ncbi:hypothetical protein [Nonomuraea bangladeshensis]|uniref:hypothetical protein n=1 Tax=Nonomuraea bangladeshensis TaxID=404385 RepID=UPI003C2CBBAD